ncbi:Alpha-(1,3)-fucosyltransferase 7, partial [Frankliniella fusca]
MNLGGRGYKTTLLKFLFFSSPKFGIDHCHLVGTGRLIATGVTLVLSHRQSDFNTKKAPHCQKMALTSYVQCQEMAMIIAKQITVW